MVEVFEGINLPKVLDRVFFVNKSFLVEVKIITMLGSHAANFRERLVIKR